MKVTHQEQEMLKTLIWTTVKYQETYNEVYDHVLTAVEDKPETEACKLAEFNAIIDEHFGGIKTLKELEEERAKTVSGTIKKKQRQYLLSYFKLPLLLFTVLVAGTVYYAADVVSRKVIFSIILFAGLSPVLMVAMRGIVRFFNRKSCKASIKDKVIEQVGCLSMSLFNMIIFLPPLFAGNDDYKFFKQAHASLIAVTAVFFVIYSLSFIRLYRDEFKMQLAS
jgi:hypothetical protein